MRVSDRLRMRTSSRQLSKLAVDQQRATEEAITGKRVRLASDDPTSFGAASRLRQESERQGSFMNNGEKAEDYFRHADSVLDNAVDILSRAREISVQFANETLPPESMVVAAEEVRALKDALIDVANTRFDGKYVFAGVAEDTRPFDDLGAYQGSATAREVSVGDTSRVKYFAGDEIFSNAGGAMATLTALEDHLVSKRPDQVRASLSQLDTSLGDVIRARQHAGHELEAIEHSRSFGENLVLQSEVAASGETDADFADTISRLTQARTSYEATVEIASRIKDMSNQILRL